ncbi:putative pheromone-processing carboxypeptidase [Clavispora lusitaniae]|uniref:Carboxypeptidase n=1 Tax=Clavispora lusitaniae TaxID=36911 RepID=A0AA91T2N1_CLALS|nr:putative pheromone-processing carboxypeptidase [Clavispora lusitaniae]
MIVRLFWLAVLWLASANANPLKRLNHVWSQRGVAKDDFLVTSLPGLSENIASDDVPLMFAGQLELYPENNTHYFFWKFSDQKKEPEAANRTIFWLNGGPGCSSMDGALMEAGPLRIGKDYKVQLNEGSWHRKGDVVFVDQPAGTGFSYSRDYDVELYQIEYHFLQFLKKYFELFPEDAHNDIVLAGESYAGQYIPYIAHGILERNKKLADGESPYHLKGLAIGNGWISPNEQSLSFVPFAVQAGLVSQKDPGWKAILQQHMKCQDLVAASHEDDTFGANSVVDKECEKVLNTILYELVDHSASQYEQCINMYDYTLRDSFPSCGMNWPPDLSNVNHFLKSDEVMSSLNLVQQISWTECSEHVGKQMKARHSKPAITLFADLLAEVEILLFHGNRDIICNYMGAESMIKKLHWGGQTGFSADSPVLKWFHGDEEAGYVKSERNLTFVNVFDASHMVPFDKPEVSSALVDILFKRFTVADDKLQTQAKKTDANQNDSPSASENDNESAHTSESASSSPSESASTETETHATRIVRLIQLAVIIILIWGLCAIYSTYRSKPTSIIKTKPSGRKKNVQWADLMPQEEPAPKGFLSKTLNKLSRTEHKYVPVDIELGPTDGMDDASSDSGPSNVGTGETPEFVIASDDEENAHEHTEEH